MTTISEPKITPAIGRFVTPQDSRWTELIETQPSDIYHLPGYLQACSLCEEGTLGIAMVECAAGTMALPLFIRPVMELPGVMDACSPYGYPCPISDATTKSQWDDLWQALADFLVSENIIAVFLRFHPLLTGLECRQGSALVGELICHGETVVMDLADDEDSLRRQIRPRFRSSINSLLRNGWRFVADDWSYLHDFKRIYHETMIRTGAGDFYFFPEEYFQGLRAGLDSHIHLHTVLDPHGNPGASGLFLDSGSIVQYHLGGTAEEHLSEAPSKLLFFEARSWYREKGCRFLNLGGGLGAGQDGLFNFKAGFSRQRAEYYTCRIILDKKNYDALTARHLGRSGRSIDEIGSYFPAYRKSFALR